MRVRKNGLYTFHANAIDMVWRQHHSAENGQRVRVIQLPSAPPPNTMGHAHIEDASSGVFLGIVSTGSLTKE